MGFLNGIFGGPSTSQQSSSASNQAFPYLASALSGALPDASNASSMISKLLGGDNSGLQQYEQNTGYYPAQQATSYGVTANRAASGMLNSGGTQTALNTAANNLNQTYANNYLSALTGYGNLGVSSANALSGSGYQSSSSGSSTNGGKTGLGKLLGAGASIFM